MTRKLKVERDVKTVVITGDNNNVQLFTVFSIEQLQLNTFKKRLEWLLFGKLSVNIYKEGKK